MLLNELNQTISDVHGLPVNPALLPLRSDRTIVYRVGCSIPYEFKRSEDLLDYVVDMVEMTAAEVKKHTTPQPTPSHVWDDVLEQWVDSRTPEQIEADRLAAFAPLTRRQFKLALLENNLLSQIDQVIAAIEDPATKARYEIEYTESTAFYRNSPVIIDLMGAMSLTADQVDAIWNAALSY